MLHVGRILKWDSLTQLVEVLVSINLDENNSFVYNETLKFVHIRMQFCFQNFT
jgi:hypothetical protein